MPEASFGINAVLVGRRFFLDAAIVGSWSRHDRTVDHFGTQDTTTVILSSAIGEYPAGTTVQSVLAGMVTRLIAIESSNHRFGTFSIEAFLAGHFSLNAVFVDGQAGSATLDAVISLTGPEAFTLDAVIFAPASATSFSLDAFLV